MALQRIEANNKQFEIKRIYKKIGDINESIYLNIKNDNGYDALIQNDQFYFMCNEILNIEFTDIPFNK